MTLNTMKTTRPKTKQPKPPVAYNHYWLYPSNAKPAPDPSDDSEPEEVEYDDWEQGGFFGDFCLGCGERCIGGDAYCSIYCHIDALRTSAAPKPLPVPIFPTSASYGQGSPNDVPTHQVSETYAYLFPIVFVAPASPQPQFGPVACSPPKKICSVASSSSLSSSSSDASFSGSASSVAPESPIERIHSTASRPPPSPSIKATLAGPSLSPPIAIRPAGTGGHAALALRQALGISLLAPIEPLRRASEPVSSNWLKSLVTGRKDSRQERLAPSPSSGSLKSLSI